MYFNLVVLQYAKSVVLMRTEHKIDGNNGQRSRYQKECELGMRKLYVITSLAVYIVCGSD